MVASVGRNPTGAPTSRRAYATETDRVLMQREIGLLEDAYSAGVAVPQKRVLRAVQLSARTRDRRLVEQMNELAVRLMPNNRLVRNVAASAYGACGAPERVLEALHRMDSTGLKKVRPNRITWNVLIASYARTGQRGQALTALDQMQEAGFLPDQVTFNSLIKAHVAAGALDDAIATFREMQARRISPCARTYLVLIDAHLKEDLKGEAKRLLLDMESRRISPPLHVLTAFIYASCKANAFEAAQRMLHRVSDEGLVPDRVTYTALIEGLGRNGLNEMAARLFSEMAERCEPDALTYTSLVKAFVDQPERAWSFYEDMQQRGVLPDTIFYRQLITSQVPSMEDTKLKELAEKAISVGITTTPAMDALGCRQLLHVLSYRPAVAVHAWRAMLRVRNELKLDTETFGKAYSLISAIGDAEALSEHESARADLFSSA